MIFLSIYKDVDYDKGVFKPFLCTCGFYFTEEEQPFPYVSFRRVNPGHFFRLFEIFGS